MSSIRRILGLVTALVALTACGGGSSGGSDAGAQPPPTTPTTYSVTTSVTGSGSGSISPTSRSVSHGASTSFTISPAAGSNIASVSGCGGSLSGTTYTTGVITGICTVTASFSVNAYTVTSVASAGGSISPASVSVPHGESTTLTVTPSSGYLISEVTGCGGSIEGNIYTTAPVTTDCQVSASFLAEADPPTANAGNDQVIVVGETANLDGSGSNDPQGRNLVYAWSLISKPTTSTAVLSGANTATPSIILDTPGEYEISLVVSSDGQTSAVDTVLLTGCTEFVGGVISGEVSIARSQSPYLIRQTVQVPFGSGLFIEPGVEIFGASNVIRVAGNFSANGEANDEVILRNVHIEPVSAANNELFSIGLQHVDMRGGSLYRPTGYAIYGGLTVADSRFQDLENYIYLWYPQIESRIERNVFIRSGGISTGTSQADVVVRNNVFYQQRGDLVSFPYAVENWAAYSNSQTVVELNSFLSTNLIALRLPPGYDTAALNGANNYWGTLEEATIDSMIFDANDDIGSAGTINYLPFLTEPDPATPSLN